MTMPHTESGRRTRCATDEPGPISIQVGTSKAIACHHATGAPQAMGYEKARAIPYGTHKAPTPA
ncbi:MAG: hypothetical protein ACYSW8_29350, partial [Planctomycetota bacterium]